MYPKVAVIILNWNGWKDTIECLESVFQVKYPNFKVILVDNNSQDDSLEKIREYCQGKILVKSKFFQYQTHNKPLTLFEFVYSDAADNKENDGMRDNDIILIRNQENLGFAAGNNRGIKIADRVFHPEYFLLLNNDTVVDDKFLHYLIEKGDQADINGFLGPKTYFYDRDNVIQAAGGGMVDFKHGESSRIAHGQLDDGKYDQDLNIDYVMGSCLLVKKEVINKVGWFDSSFFMYWEDVDWCFRGIDMGYKSIYVYKAKIWHKEGTSSESSARNYYHTRNRLYFMRRHASKGQYLWFLSYFLLYIGLERLFYYLRKRDLKMYNFMFKGLVDGLKGTRGQFKFK